MNSDCKFYFLGLEPVFVFGFSSVLYKLNAHTEVVCINNVTDEIFRSIDSGCVLISQFTYIKFQHCFIDIPSYKIIVMIDDIDDGLLTDYILDSIGAYFSYYDDLPEIEFGLGRILLGKKYISQNILKGILPNVVVKRKSADFKEEAFNRLSRCETKIFKYLQDGLSNKEIFAITGLKPSTISTYKRRIFKKFNTRSIVRINNLLQGQYSYSR